MIKTNSGGKKALSLFKWVVRNVPAYNKFLKKNGIKSANIRSITDFNKIPMITKDNYLRKYPLLELVSKKKIPEMISVSSGSSGKPFYWPRSDSQEETGADMHEIIFRDIFKIGKKRTLVIICFSMGTWIAGTFTMSVVRKLVKRGYNIAVVTPGIEKEDVFPTGKPSWF